MKRLLVVLAVLSALFLLVPAYSVANAKSPKPQDQVKNFMNAAASLKASKAAGYWVTEESTNVSSKLAKVSSGTKISLSKLKLVVNSQTADTAEVTATYMLKVQLKGQKKAQQSSLSDTFNLKLVNGTWLISGTTMLDKWVGLITPSTPTATPTAQATATAATTATPTPSPTTSGNPVKIGAIGPWSGPFGMAGMLYDPIINLVEDQVKNQGGILGGRDVKFIRADDRGVVAESAAQAKKVILENNVTILTWGGVSGAHFNAVADVAEQYKVPYVGLGLLYGLANKHYSACIISNEAGILDITSVVVDFIKPKTVAFLSYDGEDMHALTDGVEGVEGYRQRLKDAGINIVYEQYFPQDVTDLSPYLTKIKYLKPDLAFIYPNNPGQTIMVNKQIQELGGWGGITYVCGTEVGTEPAAVKLPSAVGTYTYSRWLAGSDEPGMKAFEDSFKQKYGKLPNYNQAYAYNDFWTAIKAIEMAGTDNRDSVAQALRSGKLEWDSAWGPLSIDSTGTGWYHSQICQIQAGGKLVKVFTTGQ